jgi:phage terminase large subunit-like protein
MSRLPTAVYDWPTTAEGVIECFADGNLSVDKMLDYPDVSLDWYVPSLDAIDFINTIRLILGDEPENTNPKAHYFLIDCIFQHDNVKPYFTARGLDFDEMKGRTVVMATREFGKSVFVVFLILYLAVKGEMPGFGKVRYGIYVSDSMRNGVETTMTTIAKVYYESEYLQSMFEETRLIQTEINFIRKPRTKKEIAVYKHHVEDMGKEAKTVPGRMKRTLSIKGLGAATGGRGSRDGLARPEFAIFDDMIPNEKDAESDTILSNIESTIEADVLKALSGNGNFAIAIGTPYNKKDPIYRRIEDGSWLPVVFPRAEKPPVDGMKEEEFNSVWPDRHDYRQCRKDYVIAKKAQDSGNEFPMRSLMQENYLRISNDADRLVPAPLIQWYSRQDIAANAYNYNWYITTDFTSTGSKGSDYSGIAVWAVGSNGDYFLVDLTLRKMELETQYGELFRHVHTYGDISREINVGVEIDGQQNIHILALKDRMVKRNEFFTIARQKGAKLGQEGIRSRLESGSKHWRFRMMLPQFQNRKIWFPKELEDTPDMRELLEEIKYCTYTGFGSRYDDGIDLISQLGLVDIMFPAKGMTDDYRSNKKSTKKRGWMWQNRGNDDEEVNGYSSYV